MARARAGRRRAERARVKDWNSFFGGSNMGICVSSNQFTNLHLGFGCCLFNLHEMNALPRTIL